jgi:hypothetical protein
MLKKIEMKVHFLFEAREYIASTDKKKSLDDMEADLHKARRNKKIENKKLEDKKAQEERKEKNMARIRK